MEFKDGQFCYIKLQLPDDFGIFKEELDKIISKSTDNVDIMQIDSRTIQYLESKTEFDKQTLVFQGCGKQQKKYKQFQEYEIIIEITKIQNPYSLKESGIIKVMIAQDIDFSKIIQETTTDFTVPSSTYQMEVVNDISINVQQQFRTVQEEIGEMEIKFTPANMIPGTSSNQIFRQGVVLKFPRAFSASQSNQISATWDGEQQTTILPFNIGDCLSDFVCYEVYITKQESISQSQMQTIIIKRALNNPTSVNEISKFSDEEFSKVGVKTRLGFYDDQRNKIDWYDISEGQVLSDYKATHGTIKKDSIKVAPPSQNEQKGITQQRISAQTYAQNQILDVTFKPTHTVPAFGFVLIRFIENTFIFSDKGTTTANYDLFETDNQSKNRLGLFYQAFNPGENENECNAGEVTQQKLGCIIGILNSEGLTAEKEYTVRLAGLRNPRIVSAIEDWTVMTFDAFKPTISYQIDVGIGGIREITEPAPINIFGVEPTNTINGALTKYFITWYSEIDMENGDTIKIPFPAEIQFDNSNQLASRQEVEIDCDRVIDSIIKLRCKFIAESQEDQLVNGKWKYGFKDIIEENILKRKAQYQDYQQYKDKYNILIITLDQIQKEKTTGLFKIEVDNIINPPSRRGSSYFGRVTHQDKNDRLIQHYDLKKYDKVTQEFQYNTELWQIPPIQIQTDKASDFKGEANDGIISDLDITLYQEEYDVKTTYELRFKPSSIVREVNYITSSIKLVLSYPSQVRPDIKTKEIDSDDKNFNDPNQRKTFVMVTEGCQLYQQIGELRTEARCYKSKNSEIFIIFDALNTKDKGFSGTFTILLEVYNPKDNWEEIGFKLKSYEVYQGISYEADKLEGKGLIPKLQCKNPCRFCTYIGEQIKKSVTGKNGEIKVKKYAKEHCTACWVEERPKKYLQHTSEWKSLAQPGKSQCQTACDPGFTSNGDKKDYKCIKCNERCLACKDRGDFGDRDKCTRCNTVYPQAYSEKETCLINCRTYPDNITPGQDFERGLFRLTGKQCANCAENCRTCDKSQFNCQTCHTKLNLALYQVEVIGSTGKEIKGRCVSDCPTSYFMDREAKIDEVDQYVCKNCQSPCLMCENNANTCTQCDGAMGQSLLWENKCFRECPRFTAADISTQKCIQCPLYCAKCSIQGTPSCLECEQPKLLDMIDGIGKCVSECRTNQGYRPNKAHTQCINKTEFPEIGPIFAIMTLFVTIAMIIVKYCFKKETEIIPSLIASVGVIEYFAILFQIWMCAIFIQPRYLAFTLFAFGILMILNIYNMYFIKTNVASKDARKQEKLSQKKVKKMIEDYKKKEKRRLAYAKAMDKIKRKKKFQKEAAESIKDGYKPIDADADQVDLHMAEGGAIDTFFLKVAVAEKRTRLHNNKTKIYDLDNLSDPGSSISQQDYEQMKKELEEMDKHSLESFSSDDEIDSEDEDLQYEGGKAAGQLVIPSEQFLIDNGLIKKGSDSKPEYYQEKDIEDRGFNKWVEAYDKTAVAIQWISLFVTFKVYRMTYSYFMGRKQFLVLYQKKKFKKHTIVVTLLSQFLVELPLIICGVVGLASLPFGEQLILTCIDTLAVSLFLIVIEFVEIARLDKIMKTANTRGHKAKKSAAACEDSDDDALLSDSDENDDDYPDWRLMIKNVEGNHELFATTTTQLKLNELNRLYDPRIARSCVEFNTGTEKEDDPREVRSFPTSPRAYLEFEAPNFGNYGNTFDNCYAESKGPLAKDALKTYSEMGTQAQPSEILTALARKGGDLVTPGLDTDGDYSRRKGAKKKRGRKNKYITQIDAEDDEEADQMSDGSEDDGLDGIKEEDEEDEEERLAKLAKQKADAEAAKLKKAADKKSNELAKAQKEEESRKKAEEEARLKAQKEAEEVERQKKEKGQVSDNQSELSLMMAQSTALKGFNNKGGQVMEVPPTATSRRFNECDIIGNLDRDEKGNVIVGQGQDGPATKDGSGTAGKQPNMDGTAGNSQQQFFDKEGKPTNERGYLIDPDTGDVINNMNGEKMFSAKDLDEKGEVPAPFNVEKHNFNPHLVRGDFDYDRNGRPIIKKDSNGNYVDKRGNRVSARGYRVDQAGNILDNFNRKKFDKAHTTSDGDLPKLFNYNGRRFDICDVIGQLDKDANGNIQPLTDQKGNLVDNLGRRINSKGYLIDEFGNVIDKDGRQIFEAKHLSDDEIPKIFPFTKFNIKNVLGDFEMDPLGNPILDKDSAGNLRDRQGRRVNSKGYLIDNEGNIINKHGKLMFPKKILDNEDDIPKVFRTGLLKSDTASSLSRLMSEIGKNQPSEFDQEEKRIQEEIAQNIRRQKRGNSGNTSVDSMMEDTPANYNLQNQRFDGDMGEGEGEDEGEDDDEYGSQYDQVMGTTGQMGQGPGHELAKKRRKKKKKKKKKKQEMEDPSLREHLLAGAYGGVAKPKPKRQGVKYTTDINAGLRDLATPGEVPVGTFMRDPSKKMIASLSGFANMAGQAPESSRGKRNKTIRSSHGRSEIGSNIGSRAGGGMKRGDTTSKLLDPQQREEQLKKEQMDEINARKAAKLAARKRKLAGKPGKISKDADFEKMFGKDIDEFLEDSEWDIESIDKMSQFSKNSKQTIRSAAQAGKLRGLEKLYLQRIETSMNKNTLQMTGQPGAGIPKAKKKEKGFRGDSSEQEGSLASPSKVAQKKQAWETASRKSKGSQFRGTK